MDDCQRVEEASDRLVATIVLAFSADPFVRWLLPEPEVFVASFTEITTLHAARTVPAGGGFMAAGGRAAALWYPPGVHPDGDALRRVFRAAGAADRVAAVFGQAVAHEPLEPRWYLRQIGVDPALQRAGLGSALLQAALEEIDRRGEAAYLEATTAAGRRLYERHGFVVTAEISVDGSPPLWPMTRSPRRA